MPRVTYTFDEPVILPCLALSDREVPTITHENKYCQFCLQTAHSIENRCTGCGAALLPRVAKAPKPGMIRIPAGCFIQGVSDENAAHVLARAKDCQHTYGFWYFQDQIETLLKTGFAPRKDVSLPAFDIDAYPVTNTQYAAFCRACNYPHHEKLPQEEQDIPNHPVVNVSWIDALCYALWSGKRLPTASEWQKAARGAEDDRLYPWGNQWDANRCRTHESPIINNGHEPTLPVDYFSQPHNDGRSPFGVCDMVGNVMEWVVDKKDDHMRIRCGGAWLDIGEVFCTVASVKEGFPTQIDQATGFRCASDIDYEDPRLTQ